MKRPTHNDQAPDSVFHLTAGLAYVDLPRLEVVLFDGVNFEEAVKTFKYR